MGHQGRKRGLLVAACFALSLCFAVGISSAASKASESANDLPWLVGTGIYDVTGPAAETGMMGYCMMQQMTYGIHIRLRARAFIFVSPQDSNQRLVFVNLDLCMIMQSYRTVVLQKLAQLYGNLYREDNVLLTGTHTHAGPGGYAWRPMWNIPTLGFHEDNFNAVVNGIVKAIQMAHSRIQPASLFINVGNVPSANINRSPTAYLGNPAEERAKYDGDTDTTMTLIKIVGANGKEMGTLNWFPVHGTSMSNTNGFISGDNKGYAEFAFERLKNPNNSLPGQEDFIAAFAQSNSGDVSPNTRGAFCDNGDPCEVAHSTCGGWSENCHGYGPGKTEFESTQIIGGNQFKTALDLYNSASVPLVGPMGNVFTYVNMENVTVSPQYSGTSQPVRTCPAAMGDAFAAGTTDGPGEFNFKQGTNGSENAYWNWLASHILAAPPAEVVKCQYPKPILIYTGGLKWPCEWTQGILPLQMFRLGQLFIAATPVEVTTMSGRRLRASITAALTSAGITNPIVVLASPSNSYSHYVTTPEEFIFQRYEGASTLFGPWTLPAYQQEYSKLAVLLAKGQQAPVTVRPMDCSKTTFSLQPGVIVDEGPFGKVQTDVKSSYKRGETVSVVFWSANPRNNLRTADTFLTVERQVSPNNWVIVANDGDWATKYRWSRKGIAGSLATITWDVPLNAPTGSYRIRHFGDYKSFDGDIHSFTGTSSSFVLN